MRGLHQLLCVFLLALTLCCHGASAATAEEGTLWISHKDDAEPAEPVGSNGRSIAINFFGIARSLRYTYNSITTNLIGPIERAGYKVDIFLHTYDLDHIENTRSHESTELNTTEWRLLKPLAAEVTSQTEFLRKYQLEIEGCRRSGRPGVDPGWSVAQDPEGQNLTNFFCQLGSIARVARLWQREHTLKRYKAVIYARPDVLYTCPFPVNKIHYIQKDTLYVPNFHTSGGLNDRFQLSTPEVAAHIGERLFLTIGTCANQAVHAERYMAAFAATHNITTESLRQFPFFRIRANGRLAHNDLVGVPPPCDMTELQTFMQPDEFLQSAIAARSIGL